jgi:hypothetical protein
MRNKAIGVTIVLLSVLCLPACMLRMAGPCLGYGCPAMSGSASAHASNASAPPASAAPPSATMVAQNTAAPSSDATPATSPTPATAGKKKHRFLWIF